MSTASIWSPGSNNIPVANPDAQLVQQEFTATAGQTLFVLTDFSYVVGFNALDVYVNGVKYPKSEVTETSTTSFTLATACEAGDIVEALGNTGIGGGVVVTGGGLPDTIVVNDSGGVATATGTNAIAIGNAAVANGAFAHAFGEDAEALADLALAVGTNPTASGNAAIAIGANARARSTKDVALGWGAGTASDGDGAISIGYNANSAGVTSVRAIAIGHAAEAQADRAIAIGSSITTANGVDSIAIGNSLINVERGICIASGEFKSNVTHIGAVVIGYADSGAINEVTITDGFGNLKIKFGGTGLVTLGAVPDEYIDDATAAIGGVAVGGIYRTGSALKVRVS